MFKTLLKLDIFTFYYSKKNCYKSLLFWFFLQLSDNFYNLATKLITFFSDGFCYFGSSCNLATIFILATELTMFFSDSFRKCSF